MILSGRAQQAIFRIEQAESGEDLVRRLLADAAGVVEDQARRLRRADLAIAAPQQHAGDLFGVVIVHLAAEGLDVKGRRGVSELRGSRGERARARPKLRGGT